MWILESMHADTMRTAAGLLARRGYENVQASALAEALCISVGTLYRHYGSKLGLALAVRDFTEKELSYQADIAFMLSHDKPGVDFAQAFFAFWWELAWWALTKPDLFHFTFLHWHAQAYGPDASPAPGPRVAGALVPTQSYGGATRALVRQVLEQGEREGALAPGCALTGEGLVWGTLLELARAAWQGEQVGEAEVRASARALWRALAREEDTGPRGNGGMPSPGEGSGLRGAGTPSSGDSVPSPATPASLAAASSPEVKQSEVKQSEVKQSEVKQSEVKQSEVKQSEVKQSEVKQSPVADSSWGRPGRARVESEPVPHTEANLTWCLVPRGHGERPLIGSPLRLVGHHLRVEEVEGLQLEGHSLAAGAPVVDGDARVERMHPGRTPRRVFERHAGRAEVRQAHAGRQLGGEEGLPGAEDAEGMGPVRESPPRSARFDERDGALRQAVPVLSRRSDKRARVVAGQPRQRVADLGRAGRRRRPVGAGPPA